MAKNKWRGGTTAVVQVIDVTPATIESTDVFKIDASDDLGNSYQITFTATDTTVQNVVEGLKAAVDAASAAGYAPWNNITASEDDTKLTLTAGTAGKPFYLTCTTVDGGGADTQTLTPSTITASAGPEDYNTALNWSLDAVPVTTNEVIIPVNAANNIVYGLDQSSVLLASFARTKGCTKTIGNANAPLQIDADAVHLAGTGLAFIEISNPTSDVVITEAGGGGNGVYGTNITGSEIETIVVDLTSSQSVGIATQVGEAADPDDILISGGGTVVVGAGVTGAPNIEHMGSGTVESYCAVDAVNTKGTYKQHDGAIAALTIIAGQTTYNSDDAATTIILNSGAHLTMGPSAANPTTVRIRGKGWTLNDIHGRITSKHNFDGCSPGDGRMNTAPTKGWTPSAVA